MKLAVLALVSFLAGCSASTGSTPTAADCPDAGDFDLCAERARESLTSPGGKSTVFETCRDGETLVDAGCVVVGGSANDLAERADMDGGVSCSVIPAQAGAKLRAVVSCCLPGAR